jgi:hypothetical protein
MTTNQSNADGNQVAVRYVAIGLLAIAAFFGAYRFAQAQNAPAEQNAVATTAAANAPAAIAPNAAPNSAPNAAGGSAGGSCCGGSGSGGSCCGGGAGAAPNKKIEGTAKLSGGVQSIDVKVTLGYSPNLIHLKAGVPAEINFSSAQGCTSVVQSQELAFQEDLSTGPKTVKLQGLPAGTYTFACGMNMVQGQIVVQ